MVATIVANLFGDRNVWSAVLFGLCNAGEAVLTAWIIFQLFGSDFRLSKLRNVLGLAAAAIIAAAVSGIGGARLLEIFFNPPPHPLAIWELSFAPQRVWELPLAPRLLRPL